MVSRNYYFVQGIKIEIAIFFFLKHSGYEFKAKKNKKALVCTVQQLVSGYLINVDL